MKKPGFVPTNDFLRVLFVFGITIAAFAVFFVTPALSTPMALSVVATMLISPAVTYFERRGFDRGAAIATIFILAGIVLTLIGYWSTSVVLNEWDTFRVRTPEYFSRTMAQLREFESVWKLKYPILERFNPTETLVGWGEKTGKWFIVNAPAIVGDFLTWIILVPFVTYVFLKEGRRIKSGFFQLVPNRFFESSVMIFTQVSRAISDYMRAKILEALILGAMVTVGLWAIGAPYAIVLGSIAAVTNIIPYLGPILGAVPGLLIMLSEPAYHTLFVPVLLVFAVANVIDSVLIFPVFVAKIVNLHPFILITAVVIGQQYYGLIGMLISIPLAAALKVILIEIYWFVYKPVRRTIDERRY